MTVILTDLYTIVQFPHIWTVWTSGGCHYRRPPPLGLSFTSILPSSQGRSLFSQFWHDMDQDNDGPKPCQVVAKIFWVSQLQNLWISYEHFQTKDCDGQSIIKIGQTSVV